MTPPRVSVVIPCFNLGRYLEEAVDSVFDQTFQDFEIVIVNDGSTDAETNQLLARYRRPNTRVLTTGNRGLASARNLGIWSTRGPYICALDADDRLERTYLAKAVTVLDTDPSVSFVSSWLQTFGDEDWLWKQDRCDLVALLAECTVCTAALVRRTAVEAVGGFDERMPLQGYEDWDLWISLVEQGFRGMIIPEALFFYRRRAGSMSSVCCEGEGHLKLMKYLLEKHQRSYREHLREVLLLKEDAVSELLRTNYELEHHLRGWLIPEVARRREELTVLEQRLHDAATERDLRMSHERLTVEVRELTDGLYRERREAESLRNALLNAHQGIAQLMRSRSWKLTAPLRAVHDWLARVAGNAR